METGDFLIGPVRSAKAGRKLSPYNIAKEKPVEPLPGIVFFLAKTSYFKIKVVIVNDELPIFKRPIFYVLSTVITFVTTNFITPFSTLPGISKLKQQQLLHY